MHVNPQRPLIADLDTLPFPDKDLLGDLWPRHYNHRYQAIASRGCPYRCAYCCHSFLSKKYKGLGPYYRSRSVDHFLEELCQEKGKRPLRAILIHDNAFIANRVWFREFAAKYARRVGLPYFCWVKPDSIDEETIELMKSSGCATVWIGVSLETGEAAKRLNRHGTNNGLERAVKLLRKTKIYVTADNLLGIPGQKSSDLRKLVHWYLDHPVDNTITFFLRYYPGIELIRPALELGLLTEKDVRRHETEGTNNIFFFPDGLINDEFRRLSNLLLFATLLPARVMRWFLDSDSRLRLIPKWPLWAVQQNVSELKAFFLGKHRIPVVTRRFETLGNYARYAWKKLRFRPRENGSAVVGTTLPDGESGVSS